MDCQLQCQSRGYADCEGRLTGGCKAQCAKPEGALFCDGQFVDTGDRLKQCVDALDAMLHVKVDATAWGSAGCKGNECSVEIGGSGGCSCEAAGSSASSGVAGALFAVPVAIAIGAARRRRGVSSPYVRRRPR